MYIDFHTHVKLSKKTKFMPDYFAEMMREAKESGLTAIAMTEHFNTLRYTEIYDYLDAHYSYEEDYYNIDGLKLFPGLEVDVKEIGHILIIGKRDDILAIHSALENHMEDGSFIAINELLNLAEGYDVIKIGAHPFRKSTPLYQHDPEQLKRLDAFDLNGKDLYSQGEEQYIEKIKPFAENLRVPIVGGSDTHQFLQYGCIMNKLKLECHTIRDLRSCIIQGKYSVEISPSLPIKVKSAKLAKKLMKQMIEIKANVFS